MRQEQHLLVRPDAVGQPSMQPIPVAAGAASQEAAAREAKEDSSSLAPMALGTLAEMDLGVCSFASSSIQE